MSQGHVAIHTHSHTYGDCRVNNWPNPGHRHTQNTIQKDQCPPTGLEPATLFLYCLYFMEG